MSDELEDIQGLSEPDAIVKLVKAGYDDLIYAAGDWEQGYGVVDVIEGDEKRWTRCMRSIVLAPSGKHFALDWERGLTECQEGGPFEYTDPEPVEVKRVEKVVTVTEWVAA